MLDKLKSLIGVLTHNWWLKLLALGLSAVSYYAIRGATGYEVDYIVSVAVEVENGIAVLNQDPSHVRVRFRGSRDDLLKLDERHIKALLKPKAEEQLDGAERAVTVGPRDIEGVSGVSVVQIEPATVNLTFDREVEMTVDVTKPRTIGTPLIGSVEIEYEPTTVVIRGPKRRLQEMKHQGKNVVAAEPVDVDGRVESFSKKVRILPPSDAWVSRIDPSEVTVKVNIVTKLKQRQWEMRPVLAITRAGTPLRFHFEPPTVDVAIEGRVEVLDGIGDDSVSVLVDCSDLKTAATYELPVIVHLPCQLEVKPTVEPQTVTVVVSDP